MPLIRKFLKEEPYFPEIIFNEDGKLSIKGESYMEDVSIFYNPLFEWIKNNIIKNNKEVYLTIELYYFNTSSSKAITELILILSEYFNNGGKVKIDWLYDKYDDDMLSEIKDISVETGIKFNIIPVE